MHTPAIDERATRNGPRYRIKPATEGGYRIGWMVIDSHEPDAAPMSQHWDHTDAVIAAEALNGGPVGPDMLEAAS